MSNVVSGKLRFKFFAKKQFSWQNSEFLRQTRSHPFVIENLFHSKKITTIEQEQWYWDVYSNDLDFSIYIVYDEEIQTSIGYVQFHLESILHRRCEVGYVVHPSYQNMGYGSEIIKWSMFNVLSWEDKINRLWLTVFPENKIAISLYEKYGFRKDGIMKDYVYKDGKYRSVMIMSVLLRKA